MVRKKALLLVIDSLGVGHMEDAASQRPQDLGANTLAHVMAGLPHLDLPNLLSLGLGNLLPNAAQQPVVGSFGVLKLQHQGADSYMGHQELMGAMPQPPVLAPFAKVMEDVRNGLVQAGLKAVIPNCRMPYLLVEDLVVVADNIETDYGQIYNVSAPLTEIDFEQVLAIGKKVRELVAVNRVIALGGMVAPEQLLAAIERREDGLIGVNSPRSGVYGPGYQVRHMGLGIDASKQLPALLTATGWQVSLVGKMQDVIDANDARKFPAVKTEEVLGLAEECFHDMRGGLVAATVQETDLAGHAQDIQRYGRKLEQVDEFIGRFVQDMEPTDLLLITGDHGNDPTIGHSQHTREKTPIIVYGKQLLPSTDLGERETLSDVAATLADFFGCGLPANGTSFYNMLEKK